MLGGMILVDFWRQQRVTDKGREGIASLAARFFALSSESPDDIHIDVAPTEVGVGYMVVDRSSGEAVGILEDRLLLLPEGGEIEIAIDPQGDVAIHVKEE